MYRVTAHSRAVFAACLAASFYFLSNQSAQAQGPDRWAGFYVSGHGGLNVPRDTDSTFLSGSLPGGVGTIRTEADNGYRVGGALGYFFNRYLSSEVELSYTRNNLDTLNVVSSGGAASLEGKGNATTLSGMVNGYLSLPMDKIRPYVGGGIGVTRVSANGAGFAGASGETDDSDNAFTWQLMAASASSSRQISNLERAIASSTSTTTSFSTAMATSSASGRAKGTASRSH